MLSGSCKQLCFEDKYILLFFFLLIIFISVNICMKTGSLVFRDSSFLTAYFSSMSSSQLMQERGLRHRNIRLGCQVKANPQSRWVICNDKKKILFLCKYTVYNKTKRLHPRSPIYIIVITSNSTFKAFFFLMSPNFAMAKENGSQLQRLATEVEVRLKCELNIILKNFSGVHRTFPAETIISVIQFKVTGLGNFKSSCKNLNFFFFLRNTNI